MITIENLKLEDGFYIEYECKNGKEIFSEVLDSNNDFVNFFKYDLPLINNNVIYRHGGVGTDKKIEIFDDSLIIYLNLLKFANFEADGWGSTFFFVFDLNGRFIRNEIDSYIPYLAIEDVDKVNINFIKEFQIKYKLGFYVEFSTNERFDDKFELIQSYDYPYYKDIRKLYEDYKSGKIKRK